MVVVVTGSKECLRSVLLCCQHRLQLNRGGRGNEGLWLAMCTASFPQTGVGLRPVFCIGWRLVPTAPVGAVV